jgi:hypothetical protein
MIEILNNLIKSIFEINYCIEETMIFTDRQNLLLNKYSAIHQIIQRLALCEFWIQEKHLSFWTEISFKAHPVPKGEPQIYQDFRYSLNHRQMSFFIKYVVVPFFKNIFLEGQNIKTSLDFYIERNSISINNISYSYLPFNDLKEFKSFVLENSFIPYFQEWIWYDLRKLTLLYYISCNTSYFPLELIYINNDGVRKTWNSNIFVNLSEMFYPYKTSWLLHNYGSWGPFTQDISFMRDITNRIHRRILKKINNSVEAPLDFILKDNEDKLKIIADCLLDHAIEYQNKIIVENNYDGGDDFKMFLVNFIYNNDDLKRIVFLIKQIK